MDKLWAPWRSDYVQAVDDKHEICIFCTLPAQKHDRDNLILFRGPTCFVIMNRYPYNNGHLMVVPNIHTASCSALDTATSGELWQLTCRCTAALRKIFHAEGFNIGMNIGRLAGAGIDQHIHMHVVPRWNGDTNFMPVVAMTKVISQSLLDGYDLLLPFFTQESIPA
jgi:ATP adenylyltransferase